MPSEDMYLLGEEMRVLAAAQDMLNPYYEMSEGFVRDDTDPDQRAVTVTGVLTNSGDIKATMLGLTTCPFSQSAAPASSSSNNYTSSFIYTYTSPSYPNANSAKAQCVNLMVTVR